MYQEEVRRRQERLILCIYGLAESVLNDDEVIGETYKIREIYKDQFRHYYSDFFPVVTKIYEEDNGYYSDFLVENLQKIRSYLEEKSDAGDPEFEEMQSPFIKLCEHLNLQISQMNYFGLDEKKISNAVERLDQSEELLKKANTKITKATKKAKSLQTELIAVLSIFASIVLTFAGGINILGNSITAISNESANVYYVALISLTCGFVFFNTVFLLMYLTAKITERNIYARCETVDCSCGEEKKPKCGGIDRIRKRLPYVFYFNVLILLLMLAGFAIIIFKDFSMFVIP